MRWWPKLPEINRLPAEKKGYAKAWKIVSWTFGMALVFWLVVNGKGDHENQIEHLLMGAAVGLVLGVLFTRNWKMNQPFN